MSTVAAAPGLSPEAAFNLRKGLQLAGLSQRRLAAKTGLDESYLSKLANGHFAPSWKTAVAIAAAAGVSLDVFREDAAPLKLVEEPPPPPKRRRKKKGDS